ncbi:S41 family peptidase [SAR92 clade bacterium H455]|uniref:S41 family peptidase n=1 Tax=SAR92 clade bacterium H455 TaxID=2974818 RepID=A0ABY5TN99_9GAMM|nr:S41 family peptidase [SAR92 clade bacterium H455]
MYTKYLITTLAAALISALPITAANAETEVGTTNQQANQEERLPLRELRLFTQVFEQIRRGYVEEVADTDLLENAIAGLLLELDPHSVYLNQTDYEQLQESATGEYGGLGLRVGSERGMIKVIAPIDDSPAAKAGIEAGDFIVEVDGTPVRGMAVQKAIDKLRGEKGTSIKLTVFREGEDGPLDITVVRGTIQLSSVRSRIIEPGYGYVRVSQFQVSSGKDFKKELLSLKEKEPTLKGLIIDLRNNPGGLVPASVEIADAVLDGGTVVYTEGRLPSANISFDAKSGDLLEGTPIVVLINGGSASASEIVAGALQDHRRAAIIGTQSFGKGSVQTVIPLGDGRAVKLTTARYFTPNGRSIQAEGIVPDIIVEPAEIRLYKNRTQVREADLEGHLEQADGKKKKAKDRDEDITDDNQLYEALNVLKGFQLLGKRVSSEAEAQD